MSYIMTDIRAELCDFNTVSYGNMAEMLSNGTGTFLAFPSKKKLENSCPRMYHTGSRLL